MKKTMLLITLSIILLYVNAQNTTNKYCFINKYNFYLDSTKAGSYESEYCYERNYLNDSVFVEKRLFGSFVEDEYLFKVRLNNWYINNNGKWVPFFNEDINLLSNLKIGNYKYTVSWKKICNCIEDDLYLMTIFVSSEIVGGGIKEDFYFHPKYGIIGSKTSDYTYIRKDIISTDLDNCIPIFNMPKRNFKNIKEKYGTEYLTYNKMRTFCFWNSDMSNNEEVLHFLKINRLEWIYYNHFLYCLDTVKNYSDFACRSAEFFERIFPVTWGLLYPDCHSGGKDSVSKEEFEIIKFNTIHGASLIVNSCLFDKGTFNEEDKYYLYKKYFVPNGSNRLLNDSIMKEMHADIERLCIKLEKCD